jgi:hypothetical protein
MKTLKNVSFLLSILFFVSCGGDETPVQTGKIQFNFGSQSGGKQADDFGIDAVWVSISKSNGTVVHELLKLNLLSFGSGYISESVELPVGSYKLTAFLIVDSENNVSYACPLEDSEQAHWVTDPLPINFEVTENGTSTVVPEVLEVTPNTDPGSFGYANFGFEIVTPIDSLALNSVSLMLDGQLWKAEEVDSVVFNTDGNWLGSMARTFVNDTTYEFVFIFIQDYDFTTGVMPQDKIYIEMALDVSLPHGTGEFYSSLFGPVNNAQVTVTEFDPVTETISGTFSGSVYRNGVMKVITNGRFNKLTLTAASRL